MGRIKILVLSSFIVPICVLIASLISLNFLPDKLPFSWDILGNSIKYTEERYIVVILLPALLLGFSAMRALLPILDPKEDSYIKHNNMYYIQTLLIIGIMSVFHIFYIMAMASDVISVATITKLLGAIIIMVVGNNLPRIKDNYFIGIINPWTLTSRKIWARTHRFAGRLLFLTSIIMLSLSFFNSMIVNVVYLSLLVMLIIVPHAYALNHYYVANRIKGKIKE